MFQRGTTSSGSRWSPIFVILRSARSARLCFELSNNFSNISHPLLDFLSHRVGLAVEEVLSFTKLINIDCVILSKKNLC
jgi:hypothetical protein